MLHQKELGRLVRHQAEDTHQGPSSMKTHCNRSRVIFPVKYYCGLRLLKFLKEFYSLCLVKIIISTSEACILIYYNIICNFHFKALKTYVTELFLLHSLRNKTFSALLRFLHNLLPKSFILSDTVITT